MTHVLRPVVGDAPDELSRQAVRQAALTAPDRHRVLLAGGELEVMLLRQAWSQTPIDIERCGHLGAALVMVGKSSPDLVVVGETEGPIDPFQFLRALRQVDDVTMVVVGLDREHGDLEPDALAAGASAVVRRPFSPPELLRLLRADVNGRGRSSRPLPIDLGRLKVDAALPRIWLDGAEVLLPHMEFRLLRHLAERQGEIVPRAELQSAAWGDGVVARSNSLSVHIARLRRRFQSGVGADWIFAVRGFGYRLTVTAPAEQRRPAHGA